MSAYVQRTITMLYSAGWLTRMTDVLIDRASFGCFKSNHYRLSEQLCRLVELPFTSTSVIKLKSTYAENSKANDKKAVLTTGHANEQVNEQTPSHETEMSDRSYNEFIDLNFKKDQLEIRKENSKNTKPEDIHLPNELLEIESTGLNKAGICKLRGHASEHGHKLEHIWAVARERIKQIDAKGNRVYRYLLAMITKPCDYSARASQQGRIESFVSLQTGKSKQTKQVAQAVQRSLAASDLKVKQAIATMQTGRSANITAMLGMLKQSK